MRNACGGVARHCRAHAAALRLPQTPNHSTADARRSHLDAGGRTRQHTRMLPRSTCSVSCTLRRSARSCRGKRQERGVRARMWRNWLGRAAPAAACAPCGTLEPILGMRRKEGIAWQARGVGLASATDAADSASRRAEHATLGGRGEPARLQEASLEVLGGALRALQPQPSLVELLRGVERLEAGSC